MTTTPLFAGRLRTDPDQTRAARAAWVRGGAEACGCAGCRAWLDQRDELMSSELRALLDELGLDVTRDSAVRALEVEEGTGFELLFHLVGELDGELSEDAPELLPEGVLEAVARPGTELRPADWQANGACVELSLWLAAADSGPDAS